VNLVTAICRGALGASLLGALAAYAQSPTATCVTNQKTYNISWILALPEGI
jgi:hypothetical protein